MEMICINCPMGCMMEVTEKDGEIIVSGNQCKKGVQYAINECTAPTRMLTSSIYIDNGNYPVVPVKTSKAIPKGKIFDVLMELKKVRCQAPVKIGDVVIENILGLGADIVVTKEITQIA